MHPVIVFLILPTLFLVACKPNEAPQLTDEARSELSAIQEKLEQIAEPGANDPETLNRARKDMEAVVREYGTWLKENSASIEACEMDCLADWLVCATVDGGSGGIHPTSLPEPQEGASAGVEGTEDEPEASAAMGPGGGLGHHPPDWIEFCDFRFHRCMMGCQIKMKLR